MIQRYNWMAEKRDEGVVVLYADHEAEIAFLTKYYGDKFVDYLTECKALQARIKELEAGLGKIVGIREGTIFYAGAEVYKMYEIARAALKEAKDEL